MKRYNGIEEDPEGVYVLYTDAVKMQREAFVRGGDWAIDMAEWQGDITFQEAEAEAAKRYKEP